MGQGPHRTRQAIVGYSMKHDYEVEVTIKLYLLTFSFDVHTAILKETVRTRLFKRHGIFLKSFFKLLKCFIIRCSCTQSKLLLDVSRASLIPATVFSNNAVQIKVVFVDYSTILSLQRTPKSKMS